MNAGHKTKDGTNDTKTALIRCIGANECEKSDTRFRPFFISFFICIQQEEDEKKCLIIPRLHKRAKQTSEE